jgi:hypothetical protein
MRRTSVTEEIILQRIKDHFAYRSIVIAKENHKDEGFHYHIGVLNSCASKHTVVRQTTAIFNEWDQFACYVKCHKSWATICAYLIKEDKGPLVVGEYSLNQIKDWGEAQKYHRKQGERSPDEVLKRLAEKSDGYQTYKDDVLRQKILNHLPRMKEAFEDLKILKEIEGTCSLSQLVESGIANLGPFYFSFPSGSVECAIFLNPWSYSHERAWSHGLEINYASSFKSQK